MANVATRNSVHPTRFASWWWAGRLENFLRWLGAGPPDREEAKWLPILFEPGQSEYLGYTAEKLLQVKCLLQRKDKFRERKGNADQIDQSDERNAGKGLDAARTAAKFAGQDRRFVGYQQARRQPLPRSTGATASRAISRGKHCAHNETNVLEAGPARHYRTASGRRRRGRGAGRLRVVYNVQF